MALTPVQKELSRIAADYRRYFVLKGLLMCWLAAAGAGLLILLLHSLGALTVASALPVLAAAAFLAAVVVFWRRSRADFALREIARQIERDDPRLNSLLLAALEQSPDPKTGELSFLQVRVIREAIEANRKSPWGQKFAERLFLAQTLHFGAIGALFLVLAALAFSVPPPGAQSIARTQVSITPGNAEIEKGSAVAIVAQLPKPATAGVTLVYRSPEGGEKRVPMARSLNDPLYGFTLASVQEATRYRVEYDGAVSEEFELAVFEHPELKRADAELTHPSYTGLGATKIEDTRRISAVEGTDVRYSFYLNKPVRSARLLGTNDTLVLTSSASLPTEFRLDFQLAESTRYRLELVDEQGRTNKLPADFVFVALRNEPPKLKLQMPRGDQRVSALQEVRFEAETQDDFGVASYGIGFSVPGKTNQEIALAASTEPPSKAHEKRAFHWNLPVENLGAEPGELISYFLWAEDLGPDGQPRRSQSDMYFAEVRPFEEIFRASNNESSSQQQQQQQQQQNNPATKLLELQKEIVTATWNIQRRERPGKLSPKFAEDIKVVQESQEEALQQARDLSGRLEDEKSKALGELVIKSMSSAAKNLAEAADQKALRTLPAALEFEQAATQALLKLQAREFQVSRSRSQGGGGGGGNNRSQQQLDQLEFSEEENRYEQQSQAAPMQSPEQREALQVLSRLKELARRQQDMSERLKELQTALNEAKSEKERAELERQLKRLEEEQQQIVQDMDEVRQRMSQPENQSRMAEARQQLDQTRQQSRDAARSLENRELSQALNSSSRAEEQLEKLSDEFRKSTSSQFAEDMRQMRQQARELDEKQQEVAQKLDEMKDTRQRSLGEEGPRQQAIEALAQQRAGLTNLLQNMRQVTEQAEAAEPLLSRQLYETLRKSSQSAPEKTLETASQLLDRNFLPQAAEAQQRVGETVRELREGVERAARNVLGDEAESLRFAQRELQDLADRAEREVAQATGRNSTNETGAASAEFDPNSTNRLAQLNPATGPQGPRSPQNRPQEGQQGQDGQQGAQGSENQSQAQAQNQGQGQGQGQGQNRNQTQASNQQGGGQGANPNSEQPNGQQPNGQQPNGQQPGGAQAGGQRGGSPNFFDQWAGGDGRNTRGGGFEGPLTGADFTRWSDRLRDIEEVLQDPGLRADVARAREQARSMRMEFKRHAEEPQWNLFESEVIRPLRIIQNRVADELARLASREAVVPVDRDPVPPKYADAVSRYYERLGRD